MAVEIERKFLVSTAAWLDAPERKRGVLYRQGYVASAGGRTVRVRIAGKQAFLTIKGPTVSLSRAEFEYPLPLADARLLLDTLCDGLIEKLRYRVRFRGKLWEIDEFHGANAGLVLAEIELGSEAERFDRPVWVGREVSHLARYFNVNLGKRPFNSWPSAARRQKQ